jgi:transglutaminase-like putative cysteine protease
MSIVSMLLSLSGALMAWFTVGPGWLPLLTVVLAVLASFVQAAAALRAKSWDHWSLRALVIALVALIALPAISRVRPQEIPAYDARATPTPLSLPPAGAATSEPMAVLSNDPPAAPSIEPNVAIDKATSLAKRVGKIRYNLEARAVALGPGTDPAFSYVRDSIGFDAYPGALRGDRGTFLARAGNSWDRAMLLSTLLRAKGLNTRFATARLDDATAARLFDRLFERPKTAATSPAAPGAKPFSERLKARATRDFSLVRTALAQTPPTTVGTNRDEVINELRDHAWVQAQINGVWRDMDPTFPDSQPGRPTVQAEETFDEIPEPRWQHVTIRVAVESLADGELKTEPALEWSSRSADVLGKKMFLTHIPSGVGATAKLARMAGEQWRPALWLDGIIQPGRAVKFGSAANDDKNSAGSFFFGGSENGVFVAEWLEIDLDLAGTRTETSRRALFNRASAAARAGELKAEQLSPVPMLNDGPVPALALHNIWFTAGGHDLATYADEVAALSQRLPEGGRDSGPEEQLKSIALMNFPFLVWSEHLILPSVNDVPGVRVYADSPRVLIFSMSPTAAGPGSLDGEYDLHRDRVRAIARDPQAVASAVDRKLWFGLLEGALEHELTAAEVGAMGGTAADYVTTSALVSTDGVVTLREGATDQIQALAGGPVRADRMLAAIGRGSTLVVPRPAAGKPARGWWEISATADAKAVIDGDLGGSSYAWGKGPGFGRVGGGMSGSGGRIPRVPRVPPGGGGPSQEYLMLLQLIAFGLIYALEAFVFIILMRAAQRGITVMEELDRDFGDAEPATP